MIIDSHCHLLSSEYENVDEEIKKALSYTEKIIINGFDLESSKEAIKLAEKYKNVYAAIGIGPQNISEDYKADILTLKSLLPNKKVIAIGEIGLDYYWTEDTKQEELYVFEEMLKIAKENNLPVIIHNRKATADIYNLVKEYNVTGIIHCFSGSCETAKSFIDLGFLLGIGGIITFKNAKKLVSVLESYSLDNFVLETDSPYISPEPLRGTKNNPKNLRHIIAKIAEIKGVSTEEVIRVTGYNMTSKFDFS